MLAGCSEGTTDATDEPKGCASIVHVYLNTTVTEQREVRIGLLIDEAPGVRDSSFFSRHDAYREFKRLYRKQPEIYEAKGPSDFPSRYEVTLEPGYDLGDFERRLQGATTGIDRFVPGGCAKESAST